jgi:hypothetical protein
VISTAVSAVHSSPVRAAAERGSPADRRFLHDDEAGALEMLHQALGHDRRHHLASVVHPLAPAVAQREGERVGEVFRAGFRDR